MFKCFWKWSFCVTFDSLDMEAEAQEAGGDLAVTWPVCVCAQLCLTPVTPWTVARQAPLSMGIVQARILKWVAISFCRGSSNPRIEPPSSAAPALQAGSSPLSYQGGLRMSSKCQLTDSSWMLMM